ncbi:MAG: hypothetical protein ACFFBE_18445, partial [Promethearchaeota archaeon]
KNNSIGSIRVSSPYQWNETIINSGLDEGISIILDNNEDILITGRIYNSTKLTHDLFIIKYSSNGDVIWNQTWGGASEDAGVSITVDSSNDIYVTGYTSSFASGSHDICLLKFDSSGTLLWNETWGEDNVDKGYGVEVDGIGNVYVGGSTKNSSGYDDVVLLKFDASTGNLLKNTTWGDYYDERAQDINIDSLGNVYLTGYTDNFGAIVRDLFLLKYNTSGDLVYNTTIGDDRWHEGRSLIFDSMENVYIAGFIQNHGKGGDFILLKFNSTTGSMEWKTIWGGDEHDYGYDSAFDSKDNILIVGSTESYEGDYKKVCVAKFNITGHFQWYKTFSNNIEDVGYGIVIDSVDSVYVTGKTKLSLNDDDILVLKDHPIPWKFKLSTDATSPDIDGSFNVTWTVSLDADNYSLYQSNESIAEINENVIEIVSGNTNRTFLLEDLSEGNYYYKVIAFNEVGNKSSNQIRVVVQYPPSDFILSEIIPQINSDGKVSLSWSSSLGADNYSIYVNSIYIDSVSNKGTQVVENLTDQSYSIPGRLSDGSYYYAIIAYNEVGQKLSNCVNVTVQKTPKFFELSKELDNNDFDEDGNFILAWTRSNYSQYYLIYTSRNYITDVDDNSVSLVGNYTPDFEWPEYRYPVSITRNGTSYFQVIAFNNYGNYSSECIQIELRLPKQPSRPSDLPIFLIIIFSTTIPIFGVIIILYLYRRKRIKSMEEIGDDE